MTKKNLYMAIATLSLLTTSNFAVASNIESDEDFVCISSVKDVPDYVNNDVRRQEENHRRAHSIAAQTSELAADQAESYWGWGVARVNAYSDTLIATPDPKVTAGGYLLKGLCWVADKGTSIVTDKIKTMSNNALNRNIDNLHRIDYSTDFSPEHTIVSAKDLS